MLCYRNHAGYAVCILEDGVLLLAGLAEAKVDVLLNGIVFNLVIRDSWSTTKLEHSACIRRGSFLSRCLFNASYALYSAVQSQPGGSSKNTPVPDPAHHGQSPACQQSQSQYTRFDFSEGAISPSKPTRLSLRQYALPTPTHPHRQHRDRGYTACPGCL